MRDRFRAGDILVLFAEGTTGDGRSVLPFKSAFFGAAEYPGVLVQPVTLAYTGHHGLPMDRRTRPFYAWYGDMDLAPHLIEAIATGPIEVTVIFHEALSLSGERTRKHLAAPCRGRGARRPGKRASPSCQNGLGAARHGPLLQEGLRQDLWLPDERL